MNTRVIKHGYQVAESLYNLVENEVLPDSGIKADHFWQSMANIFDEFMPKNKALLEKREEFQAQIDAWHLANSAPQHVNPTDKASQLEHSKVLDHQRKYQTFLTDIGYIVAEQEDFSITTTQVDEEVAVVAGPQLVVPLMNARFALNAANARWGSLYDALYGTDVISDDDNAAAGKGYNPIRGAKVTAYARKFLDSVIPLTSGSHSDVTGYQVLASQLVITLKSGQQVSLKQPEKFVAYNGDGQKPSAILCKNNGLHIEIKIDPSSPVAKADAASVADIILESALTAIQDCEDSIAAVDAEDKTSVYRNWLGLMKGDLTEQLEKNGVTITRKLNPDRTYSTVDNQTLTLPGRSLLFIRNVGHLMTNDAVLTADNQQVPEGILDGLITTLISLHDLKRNSQFVNSRQGSIYIVKPKMHGPAEVAFSNALFTRIESCLGLATNTIKLGIMDEERRTSVNLKECIRATKDRIAFINTGFLDRTGDEIHTSMQAGPMARKELMKNEPWIDAYEKRNVRIGLQAGLKGKAQIGKGMWATPDEMAAMVETKIAHPKSGANCAWVPSPTAATLHVLHYHQVNVSDIQDEMLKQFATKQVDDGLTDLLTIPLLKNKQQLTAADIQHELDNNVQGLLGYVVRWIDQGTGCSKVPDIDNVGRMEDRATLRISSQHICNWLLHDMLSQEQVMGSLYRMAAVVDSQNQADPTYRPMSADFDTNIAFQAAVDLILKGKEQPSGYTEPLLHQRRVELKAELI
ncbi:malate synthase G [Psychrosphaera saromensis]|uniref:Malate synthase G n=1 Tax=Psychrosphaera saromensis TaxID=716813 RepID=A0A2S7URD9_9GAMM|nr:malate synthase G [Psychrosphaera saromensis]PQJ52513.1 malate synthase G [Psychrosphaera saromensis]GHB69104.1 malate synthase G [Psychrosphaera saromensis]GLQ12977.1 malate synthase G [Psychrosphaera saromensis]